MDEFPVLSYMQQLEVAAGQIASFDVKLWVLLQDWGQGKALYGERWETFAGNAGILQFFGNNDLATTEYVSRRLGKTRVEVSRVSEVAPEQRDLGLTGRTPVDRAAQPADARRDQPPFRAQRPAQAAACDLGRLRSDDAAAGRVFRRKKPALPGVPGSIRA